MRQAALATAISFGLLAGSACLTLAATTSPTSQPPAEFAADAAKHFSDTFDRQQQKVLEAAVQKAQGPLDQAAAKLALANWLIGVPTAGPATRVLLGLGTADDHARISESTLGAQRQLDDLGKLLDGAAPGDRRRELRQASVTLAAFTKALAATAATDRSSCSDAAVDLATVRESNQPDVAAAALLWQSYAWECAGRRERALSTLPPALDKPEQPSYDFLSRLLRCRIDSDAGQNTAALAITIRMASLADRWFPRTGDETLKPRMRLIALLQGAVGRRWLAQADAADAEARAKVEKILENARGKLYSDSEPLPAYQLDSAVPIIVQPPAAASRPAAPTTDTAASEPASER